MSLSTEAIQKLARLSRLHISPEEVDALRQHFDNLFALVDELQSIDTEGIAPMSHAMDLPLRLREDVVSEPDRRDAYQAVAPQVEQGLYLVPKVIE